MFKINGIAYKVGVESLQRSVRKDYKYDVTTEDGTRRREIRAMYRVYTLRLGNMNPTEYDRLQKALAAYDETYEITVPDGQKDITFKASLDDVSDALEFVETGGTRYFDGLSLTFTETEPMEASS